MIVTRLLLFVAISLSAVGVQASMPGYSGRVVIDSNGNGMADDTDRGLQGVVITDGCNVVSTDDDGAFTLPGYARTRFIAMTTPAGYRTGRYYLPVADSIAAYNFLLSAHDASAESNHRFIQITDTEIFNRGVDERWCSYLRDYIAAEHAAFLIHTGDICYPSGLRQHIRSVNAASMGCPVYYVLGNHDLVEGDCGEQLFESIYGPAWYSFDVGNIHYVVTPMTYGDYTPGFSAQEVLRWLRNDLAAMHPGQKLVLFNHDCPPVGSDFVFADGDTRVNLKEHNLRAWIYGHTHYNHWFEMAGVPVICTSTPDKGGIDHSASAFRCFDMTPDGLASHHLKHTCVDRMATIALPATGHEPLLTPDGKVCISVNAYYSGAETEGVSVVLKDRGGRRKPLRIELTPRGRWNWYGEVALPGRAYEIEATARFSDATAATSRTAFEIGPGHVAPTIQTGAVWSSLGGNAAHYVQPQSGEQATARVAWTSNIGSAFMASPLIADGRVFVASCDEDASGNSAIYALDAATGKTLWRYPTRAGVKNSFAWDSGSVVAQDARGNLYVLDALTGSLRWEKQLLGPSEYPYLSEGLTAAAGIVYAGNGNSLCACRIDTGEVVWKNAGCRGGAASSTTLTLCGDVLISSGQWSGLYGHAAATGKLLWTRNTDGLRDRSGSAVYKDGQAYLISGRSLFVLDPATGEVLTRRQYDDFSLDAASCPLLTDEVVIFGTAAKGLLAVDSRTHDVRWNLTTGASRVFTAPYTALPLAGVETSAVLAGNVVWSAASDGSLYGVDPATGKRLWTLDTGVPFLASPAVSGNLMVAIDLGGTIYGLVIE